MLVFTTAPDYVFTALYTVAKFAIAFTLSRIFGFLLSKSGNYDLYITTSQLKITALLNYERTRNMIKKHKTATAIPIIMTLLVFTSDFYPTLMTSLTPVTQMANVVHGLNLTTNNSFYYVPANTGGSHVDGRPGIAVDTPVGSNESLAWAGIPHLQNYSLPPLELYQRRRDVFFGKFVIANYTRERYNNSSSSSGSYTLHGLALRYQNLTLSTSVLLRDYGSPAVPHGVINNSANNLTVVMNYAREPVNTNFNDDILSDTVVSDGGVWARRFSVESLAGGTTGVTTQFYDFSTEGGYYSYAKIVYVSNRTSDHIIARSGYSFDFTSNKSNFTSAFGDFKLEDLLVPDFEKEQAYNMLLHLNKSRSEIIFSAITECPGLYRLAVMAHDVSQSPLSSGGGGRIRYLVQNISVSTFPIDHDTNQGFFNNYGKTRGRASPNMSYQPSSFDFNTSTVFRNSLLPEYGVLAADYTGFDSAGYLESSMLPIMTVSLSETFDSWIAIRNLDLLRTITLRCRGDSDCIQLVRMRQYGVVDLNVMMGVFIPVFLAILSFILTQKSRDGIFFAELPDALAAVTTRYNASMSIRPNQNYIRLVISSENGENYITIGDQILQREDSANYRYSYEVCARNEKRITTSTIVMY